MGHSCVWECGEGRASAVRYCQRHRAGALDCVPFAGAKQSLAARHSSDKTKRHHMLLDQLGFVSMHSALNERTMFRSLKAAAFRPSLLSHRKNLSRLWKRPSTIGCISSCWGGAGGVDRPAAAAGASDWASWMEAEWTSELDIETAATAEGGVG